MMKRITALILAISFLLLPASSWGAVDPAVMDAYYRDGGKIRYYDRLVINRKEYYGLYWIGTKSIDISRCSDDIPLTLAHEIGHWLYHRQVWSGTLQDMANKAFASSPLRECTDENFAVGYSMYCERGLGGKLAEFYKQIEGEI